MTPPHDASKVTIGVRNIRVVADATVNGHKVGEVEIDLDETNLDETDRTRLVAELQRGADARQPE